VKLYAGSQATGTPIQTMTGTAAGAGYAVTANAPLQQGTYTAQAQQADAAGNVGSSTANTFTVGDPVVLAAGDIAYCPTDGASRTGPLLSTSPDALVMPLGDIAYNNGQPDEYQNCYDPTWGYAKARTRPVVGPHDEGVISGGTYPAGWGYLNYFANQLAPFAPTGNDITKLYYSYDLGSWHVVVLNDSCIDGTTPGCNEGAQEQWLTADLAAHSNLCTLAVFHRPRWSSDSVHGPGWPLVTPFWNILYQYGVDLILNGSAHDYERFAPQDPAENLDNNYGIRQIIVGTGGNFTYALGTLQPNSQVYDSSSYGVLRLGLHAMSYDWQFVPVADGGLNGGNFTDSGTTTCHGPPQPLAYRSVVLADSPVSYWRLGEASGTTAVDELGANPGTYSNVTLNQPGALTTDTNPSASFNGTSSYARVPSSSSLDMTSAVTVEFWAKRRTISNGYQVIVGKPGNGQSKFENYAVWLFNNKYQAFFGNGTSYVTALTPAVNDTNWHYVVATDDGSTVRIYLDGALKASTPTTLALTPNPNPLNIGRTNSGNPYFFNGWLDEVAIYPTALSATAIRAHYTAGIAPPP
jgi:Concanavalin A-like lectin/glucanases superfamily/Calcineurin-like phosphoesterase